MSPFTLTTSERRTWQPLLTGQLKEEATQALAEIAAALPAVPGERAAIELAEMALFYGYLAQATAQTKYAEQARDFLNQAIHRIGQETLTSGLAGGLAGIAWVITKLERLLYAEDAEANCACVDEFLLERLRTTPWPAHFDLIEGLVGYGVYAVARLPVPSAVACLRLVLARLAELAEHNAAGLTWYTSPQFLPAWQRERCPQGYYNLGVAHGVPGVIGLLGQACRVPELAAPAEEMLDGAIRWILSQRVKAIEGSTFPSWVVPGQTATPTRLAWCYGDLGIATTLLLAARTARNTSWEETALMLARRAARVNFTDSGVVDGGLCHGAGGNAHLFNRLYQATGEAVFAETARGWYEHLFALRNPGLGVAGFAAWGQSPSGEVGWMTRLGFLEGAVGIGLSLLAACSRVEPTWDEWLLASIPARTEATAGLC